MRIGLIDADSVNYPNLPLMKISSFYKSQGCTVEFWEGFEFYDKVFCSKVFTDLYTPSVFEPVNCREFITGGTGVDLTNKLPFEIEHSYPDYSLYPSLTSNTAFGFLTRGCPNSCPFCICSSKEGLVSRKVADLDEFWNGQKNIVLMDPNLLACSDHYDLLDQLILSGASVDFNQGLDARFLNSCNIDLLHKVKISSIHFAFDLMCNEARIVQGLRDWKASCSRKFEGFYGTVYVLTNFNTSIEEDLYRIYLLDSMGFRPYVMIYNKPLAPRICRMVQRWCNNLRIFRSCPNFSDYKG